MLRNDLLPILQKMGSLNDLFLEHRVGIDQPGYRVGQVSINGEKTTLVWKEGTELIMDYFYDDIPEDTPIDVYSTIINYTSRRLSGNKSRILSYLKEGDYYYDRVNMRVYSNINNNSRISHSECFSYYPNFYLYRKFAFPRHVFVSTMFIPNIDPMRNVIVNHKDGGKSNYSISNLEWCSYSKNSSDRIKKESDLYYLINDDEWIDEESLLLYLNMDKKELKAKPIEWKTETGDIIKRYTKLAMEYQIKYRDEWWDENWNNWVKVSGLNLECNPCGMCKSSKCYKVGHLHNPSSPRLFSSNANHSSIQTATLIYNEFYWMFGTERQPLRPGSNLTIDHINNDSGDNRIFNLQVITREENIAKQNRTKRKETN